MQMTNRPPVNPSQLTQGWHPAYLIHIGEEATPEGWKMQEKSPTMWRWHFVVWESLAALQGGEVPEEQSGLSSAKFSPKSRYVASKAWTWATQILGRVLATGETVDWDPLYPVPCRGLCSFIPSTSPVRAVAMVVSQSAVAGVRGWDSPSLVFVPGPPPPTSSVSPWPSRKHALSRCSYKQGCVSCPRLASCSRGAM